MQEISIIMAFAGGLLSFLSPCVLPLVPAYIGYLTGSAVREINTREQKANLLKKSLGFVLGFSLIFMILGASVTTLGKVFVTNKLLFQKISGIIIIILGIHLTGLIKFKKLYYEKRLFKLSTSGKEAAPFLVGIAFAAGWTPCIGPILSSILIFAGNMETVSMGIAMLGVYSLGLAVPFILVAALIEKFSHYFNKYSKYLRYISIISGILLIIMGILIFTDKVGILGTYLDFIDFY
ncbi:MAG TPA: cytochrome c biogenesis protein CcdA [Eubacteriaceae bacterium]|jgi:cytochrome c-type biogenesis protein|nr:cytochrome c biogenesis protein CcdA [Eubacteriaceae bacterium]